jgi:hypothetical protein
MYLSDALIPASIAILLHLSFSLTDLLFREINATKDRVRQINSIKANEHRVKHQKNNFQPITTSMASSELNQISDEFYEENSLESSIIDYSKRWTKRALLNDLTQAGSTSTPHLRSSYSSYNPAVPQPVLTQAGSTSTPHLRSSYSSYNPESV